MDRGDQSYDVFMLVKGLKEEMGDRCHYILGNHDMMIRDKDVTTWGYNGAQATIDSFNEHDDYPLKYSDWIADNTELYYKIDDITVCHGGIPKYNLFSCKVEDQREEDIVWDRTMVEYPWYDGPLFIVGHTPLVQDPLYMNGKDYTNLSYDKEYSLKDYSIGVIDIDTACVYGNALTAMVIDEDKFCLYKQKAMFVT